MDDKDKQDNKNKLEIRINGKEVEIPQNLLNLLKLPKENLIGFNPFDFLGKMNELTNGKTKSIDLSEFINKLNTYDNKKEEYGKGNDTKEKNKECENTKNEKENKGINFSMTIKNRIPIQTIEQRKLEDSFFNEIYRELKFMEQINSPFAPLNQDKREKTLRGIFALHNRLRRIEDYIRENTINNLTERLSKDKEIGSKKVKGKVDEKVKKEKDEVKVKVKKQNKEKDINKPSTKKKLDTKKEKLNSKKDKVDKNKINKQKV